MKKALIGILLFTVLLLSFYGTKCFAQESTSMDMGPAERTKKDLILSVPVSFDSNTLSTVKYESWGGSCSGPKAFCISDNVVYLLDTYNFRVAVYDGEMVSYIDLSGIVGSPFDIAVNDNEVYIFDQISREVFIFSVKGKLIDKVDLSINKNAFRFLPYDKYGVSLTSSSGMSGMIINSADHSINRYDNKDYTSFKDEGRQYDVRRFIAPFADGNLYLLFAPVRDCSVIAGEVSLVYSTDAASIEAQYFFPSAGMEVEYVPENGIKIYNNSVYVMECYKDTVCIYKLILGAGDESNYKAIENHAREQENQYEMRSAKEATLPRGITSLSLTRTEVSARVSQMVNYSWTLSYSNTDFGMVASSKLNKVNLPKYIKDIKDNGSLNNGGTVSMTGIPYCWGGFMSQYSYNTSGKYFATRIGEGYSAGNVSSANPSYVAGTAGLDCSGFVSAAYGLSTKKGTDDLLTYGTAVTGINNARFMDCLVKSGHTMLYYGGYNPSTGELGVSDCHSDSTLGRTLNRSVDYVSIIVNQNYVIRTPW